MFDTPSVPQLSHSIPRPALQVIVVLQYVATARALRTYRKRSRKYTIPPVPKAAPQEPQAPRREGDRLQKLGTHNGPTPSSDCSCPNFV